ncbi:hypothetical protein BJ322DRAFT_1019414 [Thelephora terrestris]|uniref:Uncharacterized protein n=1 Tax=Thelephora terrestris TaxID=56493 RepID=A0A9P6HH22_9AGAM|nr:hypothetical protein BJ322DRAFT_1019414 [Thelephora terrestris]
MVAEEHNQVGERVEVGGVVVEVEGCDADFCLVDRDVLLGMVIGNPVTCLMDVSRRGLGNGSRDMSGEGGAQGHKEPEDGMQAEVAVCGCMDIVGLCGIDRCKGKSVSRSTYYDHSARRVRENVAALQARDVVLLPDDLDERENGTGGDAGGEEDVEHNGQMHEEEGLSQMGEGDLDQMEEEEDPGYMEEDDRDSEDEEIPPVANVPRNEADEDHEELDGKNGFNDTAIIIF